MSDKIYNGMILRNASLEDALEKGKRLREACLPKAAQGLHQEAAKHLALLADLKVNDVFDEGATYNQCVWDLIKEAKMRVLGKGIRSSDWDYSFELCFIPHKGDVLTLFFMENDAGFMDEMTALGFEDYHYQNQTDKPSECSEKEWNEREDVWRDSGMLDYMAPSDLGLSYSVINWHDISRHSIDPKAVEAVSLDDDKRRKAVAMFKADQIMKPWIEEEAPSLSTIIRKGQEVVKEVAPDMKLAEQWFEFSELM